MRRLMSAALPILLCAVILTACGDDDEPSSAALVPTATTAPAATAPPSSDEVSTDRTPDAAAETPTPDHTPTPVDTPPPVPSPTARATATPAPTAPAAPPSCLAAGVGTPVRATAVGVEFDGDGRADQLSVYGVGPGANPDEWRIRVDTAAGESFDAPLEGIDPAGVSPVAALGAFDVDGDDSPELFALVGAGASASIIGLTTRVGCDLVPVSFGGPAATFPVGGSVGQIAGVECDADLLIAWSGSADFDKADGTYDIVGSELRLDGSELVPVGTQSFSARVSEANFVYGNLTCGDVSF